MEEYIRQALDIVKAQAGFRTMAEEEISLMIRNLAATIKGLMPGEEGEATPVSAAVKITGNGKFIACHECGKNFKVLTKKHLLSHGLTPEEYKNKWGYPKNTPLVCKSLQRERSKKMRGMKLWEKRRTKSQSQSGNVTGTQSSAPQASRKK